MYRYVGVVSHLRERLDSKILRDEKRNMIVDCSLSGAILYLVPYILMLNLPLGLCWDCMGIKGLH